MVTVEIIAQQQRTEIVISMSLLPFVVEAVVDIVVVVTVTGTGISVTKENRERRRKNEEHKMTLCFESTPSAGALRDLLCRKICRQCVTDGLFTTAHGKCQNGWSCTAVNNNELAINSTVYY